MLMWYMGNDEEVKYENRNFNVICFSTEYTKVWYNNYSIIIIGNVLVC